MPVMHIGVMRVSVHERFMGVLVRMRLAPIPVEVVRMLMVGVVAMRMSVSESFVNMLVLMHLGEVQPDSTRHKGGCQPEGPRDRLAEHRDGDA
jgi:hypothetical protein